MDAFATLVRGDTTAAAGFLADALVVFEGGEAERSKVEYAGHHLPADAAFARAVSSQMTRRSGGASGDLAWVASEGRAQGRYKDRDIDRITTETMVRRLEDRPRALVIPGHLRGAVTKIADLQHDDHHRRYLRVAS